MFMAHICVIGFQRILSFLGSTTEDDDPLMIWLKAFTTRRQAEKELRKDLILLNATDKLDKLDNLYQEKKTKLENEIHILKLKEEEKHVPLEKARLLKQGRENLARQMDNTRIKPDVIGD